MTPIVLYWYVVGALLTAMLVLGARGENDRVNPASEVFVVVVWPIIAVLLFFGTAVLVARTIWKGDHRDD
jgi:hypothetical protein